MQKTCHLRAQFCSGIVRDRVDRMMITSGDEWPAFTDNLDRVWELCPASGHTLEESLIESGVFTPRELAESYSKQYLLPFFDPPQGQSPPIDPNVGRLLPSRICFDAMMAPLADDGTSLEVAIVSPEALKAREEVLRLTGRQMRPLFASLDVVESILAMLYGEREENPNAIRDRQSVCLPEPIPNEKSAATIELSRQAKEYVTGLFEQSLERRASDIYIDPVGPRLRVRLRISGSLVPFVAPDPTLSQEIGAILYRLAGLVVRHDQQPQEGTIELRHGRRLVKLQLLTCPSVAGETYVMKIKGRESSIKNLQQLRLTSEQHGKIVRALEGPGSLVIVAGPPNSGKRSTLYACLQHLNRDNRILCTVEEAIRTKLAGVNQYPARPEYGISFLDTLRTVLKRDPDVLMLSDLRDPVTAETAFRAANCGTQIIVAMNAANAVDAFTQFSSFGIPCRELARITSVVIGQRMLRRQCARCRVPRDYRSEALQEMGMSGLDVATLVEHLFEGTAAKIRIQESRGCEHCRGTGFRGGVVLFDTVTSGTSILEGLKAGELKPPTRILSDAALSNLVNGNIRLQDALQADRKVLMTN